MPMSERDFRDLKTLCELALEQDSVWIKWETPDGTLSTPRLERIDPRSLLVLRNRGLLQTVETIDGAIRWVEITPVGMDAYALQFVTDYEEQLVEAAHWIAANGKEGTSNQDLAEARDLPLTLATHFIHVFASRLWLRYGEADLSGWMPVFDVSPELERLKSRHPEFGGSSK